MTPFEEEVAWGQLETVQAYKMLHDPAIVRELDTSGYLDLCLAAGYDKETAQAAARAWANKRLDRERTL